MDKGCYLDKVEPRLWDFKHCFPDRISMGDIDGIVEINGNFLVVEWKSLGGSVTGGQDLLFKQLTRLSPNIVVYVLYGNSVTMDVHGMRIYTFGNVSKYIDCDREHIDHLFTRWGEMAKL